MSEYEKYGALVGQVASESAEFRELVEMLSPTLSQAVALQPEVALQLSTAMHEIEERISERDPLYRTVNNHKAPCVAMNDSGQVIALNAGASQLFCLSSGDGLSALKITPSEFQAFKVRLAEVEGPSLLKAYRRHGESLLPVILMGHYEQRLGAFILKALQQQWPASIDRAFGELFKLSPSERQVLMLMSRGLVAADIAAQRRSSIGTVRQQIKSILGKLGAATQVQAATLATAASASAGIVAVPDELPFLSHQDDLLGIYEFSREGRRVGWRRFGVPGGPRVLWLHGPSFGAGDFPVVRSLAREHQLDVIAIERPGYGRTESPSAGEDPLECQCLDIEALLAAQGVSQVWVISEEVALITALALHRRRHVDIRGLVSVSAAPPFRELGQINAMPVHQAIFIQAARHAPWLAKLMIRLLVLRMRKLGPEKWTDVIFEGVSPDQDIIARPSLREGVIAAYGFYVNQQGAGYINDLKVMIQDWGALLDDLPARCVWLHGDSNASTPLDHLDVFKVINPDIVFDILPGEGLTLAINRTEHVYQMLLNVMAGRIT